MSKLKSMHPRKWIPLIVAGAVVLAGGFAVYTETTKPDYFRDSALETLDAGTLKENLQTQFDVVHQYEAEDWTIYGETLTFYQSDYLPMMSDATLGSNVILRNILTGEEESFVFSGGADSGIQLGRLEEGVYEIYIYDQFTKKRVWFDENFTSDSFYTMRRDGSVKEVVLSADKELFADAGITLDQDYAFLTVTEQTPMVKVADVVIDPGGMVYSSVSNTTDTGLVWQDQSEDALSMELAEMVKERLEAAGLRVLLTREEGQSVSYYGDGGRAAVGYNARAKVFLNLSMTSEEDTSRPYFLVSPFLSGLLANDLIYTMQDNGLELETVSWNDVLAGAAAFDALMQEEDWSYSPFEVYPALRETGGKVTSAGLAENSQGNSAWSDANGMYGLIFRYANAASADSMNYYLANKEAIADGLAEGILFYFGIGGQDDTAAQ